VDLLLGPRKRAGKRASANVFPDSISVLFEIADRWVAYFVVFSLYTNSKKLFSTGRTKDKTVTAEKKAENPAATTPAKGASEVNIKCLNGIKVFSMLWIMLGHTYTVGLAKNPWVNPFAQADVSSAALLRALLQTLIAYFL
jgi:hypothetical protein